MAVHIILILYFIIAKNLCQRLFLQKTQKKPGYRAFWYPSFLRFCLLFSAYSFRCFFLLILFFAFFCLFFSLLFSAYSFLYFFMLIRFFAVLCSAMHPRNQPSLPSSNEYITLSSPFSISTRIICTFVLL